MLNVLDGTSYSTTDAVHTATATATGAITYTLSGTDAGLFDIGTNGDVVFKSATTLAASTKSTYEFTVTATMPPRAIRTPIRHAKREINNIHHPA